MSARKRPFYARMLRLRHLTLHPALAFVFFEGSIGLGVLMALADIVNGWGIVAVPVTVAVMVKLNDVVAGALAQAPHVAPVGVPPVVTGEASVPPQNRATQPGRGASMRRTRAVVGRARLGTARGIVYVHANPPDPRRPGSVSATAALPSQPPTTAAKDRAETEQPGLDPSLPTEAQAPASRTEGGEASARTEGGDMSAGAEGGQASARTEGRESSAGAEGRESPAGGDNGDATAAGVPLTPDSSAVPPPRSDASAEAESGRRSDAGSGPRSEETDPERKLADRGSASLDLAATEPTNSEPGDQAPRPPENDRPSAERSYPDRTDRNKGRFA